jgi:hypothetical protein
MNNRRQTSTEAARAFSRNRRSPDPVIERIEKMTMKALSVIFALILIALPGAGLAQPASAPVVLITEDEAKLPPLPDVPLATRAGVTRGPKILLESSAAKAGVKSPFQLRFKLATFGGAKIDPESVKVTYLKKPPVDLTDRFGKITQADGLELAAAAAPAGTHHIRVTVQDSAGRRSSASFALKVLP